MRELKICRSVFGCPGGGSEIGKALDGCVGKSGQDVGEVVADGDLEPSTAFHYGENRRHAGSGLFAADVDPVLSARRNGAHGVLGHPRL